MHAIRATPGCLMCHVCLVCLMCLTPTRVRTISACTSHGTRVHVNLKCRTSTHTSNAMPACTMHKCATCAPGAVPVTSPQKSHMYHVYPCISTMCTHAYLPCVPMHIYHVYPCISSVPSCVSIHASIHASIRPSMHPSVHPCMHPSVRPSVRPFIRMQCTLLCTCPHAGVP